MNIKMLKAAATGLVLSVSSLANAGLIIMDEDTEYIGLLTDWGSGLNFVNDQWQWNVSTDSVLSLVSIQDNYTPGDEFALYVDNSLYAWDSITSVGSYFKGSSTDIFLSQGVHTLTFKLTASCCDSGGTNYINFSSLVAVAKVPEPTTLAIFALGLMGLVSRRFNASK